METKTVPPWTRLVIAAVIAVAIPASQFMFWPGYYNKWDKKNDQLAKQLADKQAEINKGRIARQKLEELQRDIASLEQKLSDLKQILPTAPEMGDLLKWIKSLADQTNLDLLNFAPQAQADQEFLREQPITMEVLGNYHQLGMFFDRVSKYARIINVENVRISPNSDRRARATIRSGFVAKTFIYKEEAQRAPGGGA